jgi:hypothetical protein
MQRYQALPRRAITPTGENPNQAQRKEPGMSSSRTTTITLRLSHHTLAAIDDAAKRDGKDRNSYILSWVPENYNTSWYDGAQRRREPPPFVPEPPV